MTSPDAPYLGQVIANRFQIINLIGAGGMGSVYYAEDLVQERKPYAIKFLSINSLSETLNQRFGREAYICAQLAKKSNQIVRVLAYNVHEDGSPYYVMEFVKGQSLKQLLRSKSLSLPTFFTICKQICLGLQAAHEGIQINGKICFIVHRDIKPSNILLANNVWEKDAVKILDFGIAKLIGDSAQLTQVRDYLGSLPYSSPEQMDGGQVDCRSDIYSLGVVMYEMLASRSPWEKPDPNTFPAWYKIHRYQDPLPLIDKNPDRRIPTELESLVLKCLAKKPSDRPQSINEILITLSEVETQFSSTSETSPSSKASPISQGKISFEFKKGLFKFKFSDLHAILGVPINANVQTIRKRYKQIARLLHPDSCSFKDTTEKERAVQLLAKLITPAYVQLANDKTRTEYLNILKNVTEKLSQSSNEIKINPEINQRLSNLEEGYSAVWENLSNQPKESVEQILDTISTLSEVNLAYLVKKAKKENVSVAYQEKAREKSSNLATPLEVTKKPFNLVEPYMRRASSYILQKNFLKAIVELKDAINLDPNNSNCHSLLGMAYLKQNMIPMAKVHIQRALELEPNNERALQGKEMLKKLILKKSNEQTLGSLVSGFFSKNK